MTKYDINVKIQLCKIPRVKKAPQKVRGNNMKEMHINLEAATNYLVQLFYQTDKRYSCTRTKLGKLLAIVAFKYARQGIIVFNEPIYEYGENCGAIIGGLAILVDRDAYLNYQYLDTKDLSVDKVIDDERERSAFIPEKYKKTDGIPGDVKDCIKDVFARFGGYTAPLIGQFINDLIYLPNIINNNRVIDLHKIYELSKDDVVGITDKRLIRYLFK